MNGGKTMRRWVILLVIPLLLTVGFMTGLGSPEKVPPSGWGIAGPVGADDGGNITSYKIAFDRWGNAIAVWAQSDGKRVSIFSRTYIDGMGWGAPELIEHNDTAHAFYPHIATDPSGNAMAIWVQSDQTQICVWVNMYIKGGGWGLPELIASYPIGGIGIYGPRVEFDPLGNAITVWEKRGLENDICSIRYTPGAGWGGIEELDIEDRNMTSYPDIGVDALGNVLVVWQQWAGLGISSTIWSNRYVAGAGWGIPEMIQTNESVYSTGAKIAVDPSGNAVAVWSQILSGGQFDIWSNRYTAGVGWGTAEPIETDDRGRAVSPAVAVDTSGNAVAVWEQYDGTRQNIVSNRYTAGVGWGTAELIETDNTGYAYSPMVGMDKDGNGVAVWQQHDGYRFNIWSNRYFAGTGWGSPELIEFNNEGHAEYPTLAVAPSGNAIALWRYKFETSKDLWANIFIKPDTTPPPLTVSFPPDGFMTDSPILEVSGRTESGASVTINGIQAAVGPDGSFSCSIPLRDGANMLNITSTDEWGNSVTETREVTYNDPIHSVTEDVMAVRNLISHIESSLLILEGVVDNLSVRMNSSEEGLLSLEMELLELEILLNSTNATIRSLEALTSYLGAVGNLTGSELEDLAEMIDGIRSNLSGLSSDVDDLGSLVDSMRMGLEENASGDGEIGDIAESQERQKEDLDHLRSFVEGLTIVFAAFLLIFAILFISLFRRASGGKRPRSRVIEDDFE